MREFTQRTLRDESGEIMRALDAGESFVLTRNGIAVGELIPVRRKHFVSREAAVTAFARAPRIDYKRFRKDLDALIAQDIAPRGWPGVGARSRRYFREH